MANEQDLWTRLGRGDVPAFENFYRAHFRRLRGFLRVYLGSETAAEDVAQEAFVQIWRHPNGFNPGKSTLKAYLFGIARKRAADWWRHHKPSGATSSAEGRLNTTESPVLIRDALARLQPEHRSLLWLREVDGYSYDELSDILGIPLGTVKSRLFTAREELRLIWTRNPEKGEG
jgi:RNA polymerase sigma-70 factor (ECF subfamily)